MKMKKARRQKRDWLNFGNERGVALITVYLASIVIFALSSATYLRSFVEAKQIEHEFAQLKGHYAAEAGIQQAMAQIAVNAYTGFINENDFTLNSFQNAAGNLTIGSVTVDISYPSQADWVIATANATVDNQVVSLEGRIFLDSNLSKYMMYSTASTHGYGDNLQIGFADTSQGASSEGVPAQEFDRNQMYYTGNLQFSGSNIDAYGNVLVQGSIVANNTSNNFIHGDAYITAFNTNSSGAVASNGVTSNTNGLSITDGFADDIDRNQDGTINATDAPDIHDLTPNGGGSDKKMETINAIDLNFYAAHNNITAFNGASAVDRFVRFEVGPNGTSTRAVTYTNATFQTTTGTVYDIPTNGIIYVKGALHVKGEIQGRVSVVSSDDIYFSGNTSYAGGQTKVDQNHSAAFLAQDKIFFMPASLEVSGILYAQKANTGSTAVSAAYKYNSSGNAVNDNGAKTNGHFRHYGNIIMGSGSISTSQYATDRVFDYDPLLKYYRPPGIPVVPSLRVVREK